MSHAGFSYHIRLLRHQKLFKNYEKPCSPAKIKVFSCIELFPFFICLKNARRLQINNKRRNLSINQQSSVNKYSVNTFNISKDFLLTHTHTDFITLSMYFSNFNAALWQTEKILRRHGMALDCFLNEVYFYWCNDKVNIIYKKCSLETILLQYVIELHIHCVWRTA